MGFYGNTIYNTYGLQDKSVQPRHLDRNYWRWGRQIAVQSIQTLRKNVLNLPAIGIDKFTQDDWNDCWLEAEKSIFAFHFSSNNKDNTRDYSTELRALFGAGLNIGWVIKESANSGSLYVLYFMALGTQKRGVINRPGSIFRLELNPNGYTEDSKLSDYANYKDSCEPSWSNKYLVGPVLSDAHLLKNSVIEEKIKDDAVTTNKIKDLNVTTIKIADQNITTEKIKDENVTTIKIANGAVVGGNPYEGNSKIAEKTITGYNIQAYTITGAADSEHCNIADNTITAYNIKPYSIVGAADENSNIAEKTIVAYNIADQTISPEKLDRKYLIKDTVEEEITNWSQLYQHINSIYNNSLENLGTVKFLKGIVRSILPPLYQNYSIGHSIGWLNDNDVCMLVDSFNGNFWVIEKNQGQKGDVNVYTDSANNINYRIFLRSKPMIENVGSGKTELKLTAEAEYNLGTRTTGVSLIDDDLNITTQTDQKTIFKFVTSNANSISFVNNTNYPIIYMPANGSGMSRIVSPGDVFIFSESTFVRLEFYFNNNCYFCESYAFTDPSAIYNVTIKLVFGNSTTPVGFDTRTPIWGASPSSSGRIDITEKFTEFLTDGELIIPVARGQRISETDTIKNIAQLVGSYTFPVYMGDGQTSMWMWQGGYLQDNRYLDYNDPIFKEGTVVLKYIQVPLS